MIFVDTREQKNRDIIEFFQRYKLPYIISKLDYGDYFYTENPNVVVDKKFNISEIAHNICSSDHERLVRELERAKSENVKLIFLITDEQVKDLHDLKSWNATIKDNATNHTKVKGETLAKAMKTMESKYNCEFRFSTKKSFPFNLFKILNSYGLGETMYIDDKYLHFESEKPPKKITGTKFSCLLDKNPFTKKGDQMLEILGILPKEPIDPYYTYRGEITEKLVKELFENAGDTCKVWNNKEIDFDNFKDNQIFGGLIDIFLENKDTIIEVKSKSLSKKDDIVVNGSEYEFLQGALYTILKPAKRLIMCWVFYNQETEWRMRAKQPFNSKGKNEINEPNVSFYMRTWTYEELKPLIEQYMEQAKDYYTQVVVDKRIPLSDISNKTIERLKKEGKIRNV